MSGCTAPQYHNGYLARIIPLNGEAPPVCNRGGLRVEVSTAMLADFVLLLSRLSTTGATSPRRPCCPKKSPAGLWKTAGFLAASAWGRRDWRQSNSIHRTSATHRECGNSILSRRTVYRRSQLQKQIATRRTTVQVTGLSGPTMNCIIGLSLRLIIFPPYAKTALLGQTTNAAIANFL